MSDETTAVDGAQVAPAETPDTKPEVQEAAPEPTKEQTESDRARDEKGRFVPQERVNEITRARREAERSLLSERQMREQLEQRLAALEGQRQTPTDRPPSLEDFDFDQTRWAKAVTDYAVKQAKQEVESQYRQQTTQRTQQQAMEEFAAREREYAKANPDYLTATQELASFVRFPNETVEAIGHSEQGPALVHYLATHLDEADRLSRLPPHLAALQLGRIEKDLVKPKPVSKAPSPAPRLEGGAAVNKDPERMTTEEWMAWRQAQLKAKAQ